MSYTTQKSVPCPQVENHAVKSHATARVSFDEEERGERETFELNTSLEG